jgi:hypothetical protein
MQNDTSFSKYQLRLTTDHDKKVKLNKQEIFCYSQEQLDKLYPNGGYTVIGETLKKNKKEQIALLQAGKQEFSVSEDKSHNGIIFRTAGYARVGEDTYIRLLESRLLFLLLLFGGAVTLGALIILLLGALQPKDPVVIDPNHPVPPEDSNVESLEDDDSQKAEVEEGGGSLSMIYMLEAKMSLSTGLIDIYFKNPNASTHNVSLILYVVAGDQQIPIAQSGLIKAGNGLSVLEFIEGSAKLKEGVYEAKYLLSCFDPITGERALIQPEIAGVELTVVP